MVLGTFNHVGAGRPDLYDPTLPQQYHTGGFDQYIAFPSGYCGLFQDDSIDNLDSFIANDIGSLTCKNIITGRIVQLSTLLPK